MKKIINAPANFESILIGNGIYDLSNYKYVSKDYIKNITYNSRSNLYFGYDTKDLNNMMNGQK